MEAPPVGIHFPGLEKELDLSERRAAIAHHFSRIAQLLDLQLDEAQLDRAVTQWTDLYLGTLTEGLDPEQYPKSARFDNKYGYSNILLEKDIHFSALDETTLLPAFGKADVAYLPGDGVIGLSKMNRLVRYLAHRPTSPEKLAQEMADAMQKITGSLSVAIRVEWQGLAERIQRPDARDNIAHTAVYHGRFQEQELRDELQRLI